MNEKIIEFKVAESPSASSDGEISLELLKQGGIKGDWCMDKYKKRKGTKLRLKINGMKCGIVGANCGYPIERGDKGEVVEDWEGGKSNLLVLWEKFPDTVTEIKSDEVKNFKIDEYPTAKYARVTGFTLCQGMDEIPNTD